MYEIELAVGVVVRRGLNVHNGPSKAALRKAARIVAAIALRHPEKMLQAAQQDWIERNRQAVETEKSA